MLPRIVPIEYPKGSELTEQVAELMKNKTERKWLFVLMAVLAAVLITGNIVAAQAGSTHTIQPGETLFSIAMKYNTSVDAIAFANGITNPNLIFAGQVLTIPGGSTGTGSGTGTGGAYTVRSGDTLYSIARQFGTTITTLVSLNGITNPNLITVGDVLTLPGQAPAPTQVIRPTTAPTRVPTSFPTATVKPPQSGTTVTYTVKAGDTLYYIAIQYNTSVQQIIQLNGISNPNLIYVGQKLIISGTPVSPTRTPIPSSTTVATSTLANPAATSIPPTGATATQVSPGNSGTFSTPTPIAPAITIPVNAPNLLTNGSFDGSTRNVFYDSVKVVTGWEPYYCAQPYVGTGCLAPENSTDADGLMGRPVFGVTSQSGNAKSGQAQYWSCNNDTCRGGVFQIITTKPGTTCKAGAYVKSWSAPSGSLASTARNNSYWSIRIDPSGGAEAFSSAPAFLLSRVFDNADGHYDNFVEISYIFQPTSNRTTIYFENLRREPQSNNFSYIDSAYVVCTN